MDKNALKTMLANLGIEIPFNEFELMMNGFYLTDEGMIERNNFLRVINNTQLEQVAKTSRPTTASARTLSEKRFPVQVSQIIRPASSGRFRNIHSSSNVARDSNLARENSAYNL